MTAMNPSTASFTELQQSRYSQLIPHHDETYELMWAYLQPADRPCFNLQLLQELSNLGDEITRVHDNPDAPPIRYLVLASNVPGVFNLGGDLSLLREYIRAGDRGGLLRYAKACIEVLYSNLTSLGRNITTISLVQGDALGGGFEAAMSSNALIAERSAKLGLPEILFNLFPGMGAYSMLSRKVGAGLAERMILSGRLYGAEELHEMGVVDVLAEDGEGERAVYDYVKKENRFRNGFRGLREAKRITASIPYEELMQVTEVWVDAALRLTRKDLSVMGRLITGQQTKVAQVKFA